ncbi:MAG: TIGR02584 family CRISPR-associated protein [Gammaproteobacteria bacterium]|nr:TIGR02584 family CRISPR-associated protein [Gammaproteobacteria bacterium]
MQAKSQNVLFLVTGMTPAIITETIWALACDPELDVEDRWVPDRVEVLSTEHGLNQIRSRLLESSVLEKFKASFPQLANMTFDESCMHSIKENDAGAALVDLKTPEDNERAADQINERIRKLTSEENTCLHVSIAGGRKTMGFYAGYALSLHGRAQDRMSHVLVDERFENIQDFFYPTPKSTFVTDRDNRVWDASKAKIWLAEIPFVRMKDAIKKRHQLRTDSFIDTVNKINEAANDISISLDVANKTLVVNDKFVVDRLAPKEFAFFCMFAQAQKNGEVGLTGLTVEMDTPDAATEALQNNSKLASQFMVFYNQLRDVFYLEAKEFDIGKKFFEQTKAKLKAELENSLGIELAAKLGIHNRNRKSGQPFFLDIPADSITIINTSK